MLSIQSQLQMPPRIQPVALNPVADAHSAVNYPLASLYPTPVNPVNGTVGLAAIRSMLPGSSLGIQNAWEIIRTQLLVGDLTPRAVVHTVATGDKGQYNVPGQYLYTGFVDVQDGKVLPYPGS